MRALRGNEMAMIFQDPLSSLHPFYTIGEQIVEAYRVHNNVSSKAVARRRAIEMLDRVGIPNPDKRFDDYPHQFSGGMRQRAMIAMALVCDPKLLIADEPTTALDVTVQAQILELMKDLQREFNSAIILITHDLGVVAETCDERGRHVRRAVRRAGLGRTTSSTTRRCPTPGVCSARCRAWTAPGRRGSRPIPGTPPSLIQVPSGCVFNPRCRFRDRVEGGVHDRAPRAARRSTAPAIARAATSTSTSAAQIFANEIAPTL